MSAPLQLQTKAKGAWKTVIPFGHGAQTMERVKQAALALNEVAPESQWRVTTGEGRSPRVLGHMGPNTCGVWIMERSKA